MPFHRFGEIYKLSYDTILTKLLLGDEVIREICKIWNLRIRLAQLTHSIRELAKYGPMKPTDQVGIDEIQEQLNGCKVVKNEFYQMDPTGIRTGNGIGPQLTETFEIVARDAESILDKVLS